MTLTQTLLSQNEGWGFFGTIADHACPDTAWRLASERIAQATGFHPEAVREFLDSRHGRHFANDVAEGLYFGQALEHALDAALRRWMGWTISRQTSRESGIPSGLPYLTGWVGHFDALLEAA